MGTRSVEWHPVAIKALTNIFDYIFKDSPQNAVMVYQTIMELTENINVFPEKYPVEKSFGDSTIRFIPKWNFKIVYQIQTDKILVVNIYSTRQNPKKLKP